MSRKKFLQRVSLKDARRIAAESTRQSVAENVKSEDSFGRVTAEPVHAVFSAPHYRASAMDGVAVRAADTSTATDSPVELVEFQTVGASATPPPKACCVVDTGNPLPDWADAVVRIEDTTRTDTGFQIKAAVVPGRDVRRIGEDIDAGTRLLPRGHKIRPFDVGAMLATGVSSISVRSHPSIGVIATGSEIVEPGGDPKAGEVIEYNSRILAGFATEWGAISSYLGRVDDTPEAMGEKFREAAAEHDIVCVIAGSSAGRKDFTVDVLSSIGELLYHGVDMMPGKPAAFATIGETPVLGIPGYPVSAVVTYRELLEPMVAACLGRGPTIAETVRAEVRRKIPSRLGAEEFLRVALALDGDDFVAGLLPRGAGSVSTLVRADGILRIGPNSEGIEPGTEVEIELIRSRGEIGSTVVVAGAPDEMTVGAEDELRKCGSSLRMTHLNLSDIDAVEALASGEAHLAVLPAGDPGISAHLKSRLPRFTAVATARTEKQYLPATITLTETFARSDSGQTILNFFKSRTKD